MQIEIKKEQEFDCIFLNGDLDFNTSPLLRKELSKLTESVIKKLMIDLEKVNYIDSSGLATFIELFQKIKKSGGKLVLFSLKPSVRSVFEIAKLDSIFHLAESHQAAVALIS